jgi:hypothetical protein
LQAEVVSPERVSGSGAFRVYGQVIMIPADPSGLMTTRESAAFIGVKPPTIRAWRVAGLLDKQGLDAKGYPMHSREAVREAEKAVRKSALEKGGFDPRRTRASARRPEAALGFPACLSSTSSLLPSRTRSSWRYSGPLPPTSFARPPCSAGFPTRMTGSARSSDARS